MRNQVSGAMLGVGIAAFVDELLRHARDVVVEFVPKSDPMVQGLLRGRADIFPDYTEETFVALLRARRVTTSSPRPSKT